MMPKLETREILNKILNLKTEDLDKIDVSHNDEILKKMSVFALYFHYPAGREHYRLLTKISEFFNDELLYDIGSNNGCSALALSENKKNTIMSYDIMYFEETEHIKKPNVKFHVDNILHHPNFHKNTRFIMLDTDHNGTFENIFYNFLKKFEYKGLLFCDDIYLNNEMKSFWNSISQEKYDITHLGHNTGSGLVIFE